MVALHRIDDRVPEEDGCPKCGERHPDRLMWDEEGVSVTCLECGTTYRLGESKEGGDESS